MLFYRLYFRIKKNVRAYRSWKRVMKRRQALLALGSLALAGPGLISCKKGTQTMKKEIKTENAPKAIGPYSQAIEANGFIFASGQIPIDPTSGELLMGTIEEQTRLALNNLKAVLEAGGSSFDKVVKCSVFLEDIMNGNHRWNIFFCKIVKQ